MSATTTRRGLLAGSTALAAGVTIAGLPAAVAAVDETDKHLLDLWEARLPLIEAMDETEAEVEAAQAKMSWWARPGLDSIDSDGNLVGHYSGWPADPKRMTASGERGVFRRIRLSPDVIEVMRRTESVFGDATADRRREARLARLNELRAAQKVEEEASGFRVAFDRAEEHAERVSRIHDEICEAIEGAQSASPVVTTIAMLMTLRHSLSSSDTLNTFEAEGTMYLLPLLRPPLSGALAEEVDEMLDYPDRPVSELRFWRA